MYIHRSLRLTILLLGILGLTGTAFTATDQIIYDDALQNGWQDLSWATVNDANTTPVHSGNTAISVNATTSWAALWLVPQQPLDTTPYASFSFWINGGATGNQTLSAAATINGQAQKNVPIGPLTANTWQQLTIPLAQLGVANTPNVNGFVIESTDTAEPIFYVDDVILNATSTPPPPGTTDRIIYDDQLENGWQDWSWSPDNLANTSPTHSGTDSISYPAVPGTALFLAQQPPIATSPFVGLSFWVNGGATGLSAFQVQAVAGTDYKGLKTPVSIGAVAPNTWQHITTTLDQLGVANISDLGGFYFLNGDNTTPTFYIDDIVLVGIPPSKTANLTVNAAAPVRTVDPRHFGVNAAMSDSVFDTDTTKALLTDMGNQALRYPGGLGADMYLWSSNTSPGSSAPWMTSFDQFADVAINTHAQVYITVNYGSSTPEDAANWVAYSKSKGYGFKYWEVGNENYGAWETDNYPSANGPNDPVVYATRFKDYFNQMKAQDPTIKVGVPVIVGEDRYNLYPANAVTNPRTGQSHYGWTPVLLAHLQQLDVTPDFIDYHRYPCEPGSEDDATLLQSSVTWSNDAADLRQQLTDYLGQAGATVEIDCTENNDVSYNPGKQSTSLVDGLFLADSLCSAMQTEFNSVLWWCLRNYQDASQNNSDTLYGWRQYGDYGMMDNTEQPDITSINVYPTFYVFKLLKYFARGGDQIVSAASDNKLLAIYSAKRADGSLTLLAVNKSPTDTLTGNIALTGFNPMAKATVYSYGIPQDTAAPGGLPIDGSLADIAQTTISSAGASFSHDFPPYSVTVISLVEPVVANFSTPQVNGYAGLDLGFNDTSTGPITSRVWDFGDGTQISVTTTSVAHQYAVNGTYTVSLIVTGPTGVSTNTRANYITITGAPLPVALPLIKPGGGTFNGSVKVTITCSTPGATILYNLVTDPAHPPATYTKYKNPFVLTNSCTINAQASKPVKLMIERSPWATTTFTIIPPPPLKITTTSLPSGVAKTKYSAPVVVTGGTTPYKWSLASGSTLPAGLKLNATTGVIAGTPTKTGSANFTVQVTDASPNKQTKKQALTLTINKSTP